MKTPRKYEQNTKKPEKVRTAPVAIFIGFVMILMVLAREKTRKSTRNPEEKARTSPKKHEKSTNKSYANLKVDMHVYMHPVYMHTHTHYISVGGPMH